MSAKKYISNETIHRNKEGVLISNRVLRIGLWKGIGIVATSCLAGFGGAMFVRINTALSLPGRVDAIEKGVVELKEADKKSMPLELSLEKWKNQEASNQRIESKLNTLDKKVDDIRNLIK